METHPPYTALPLKEDALLTILLATSINPALICFFILSP